MRMKPAPPFARIFKSSLLLVTKLIVGEKAKFSDADDHLESYLRLQGNWTKFCPCCCKPTNFSTPGLTRGCMHGPRLRILDHYFENSNMFKWRSTVGFLLEIWSALDHLDAFRRERNGPAKNPAIILSKLGQSSCRHRQQFLMELNDSWGVLCRLRSFGIEHGKRNTQL